MSWKERDITCEFCQTPGKLIDWEYCETYVCSSCGTIHKITGVVSRKTGVVEPRDTQPPIIPLGSIFTWQEVEYKIGGFAVKKDHENYRWHEYVGISQTGGHIHLSQFNGHWNVMEIYTDELKERVQKEMVRKKDFALWNKYSVRTLRLAGSFPYNVNEWLQYNSVETVSSPYILSGEKSKAGLITYLGIYQEPKEFKKKFKDKIQLPSRTGIVGNQPFYKLFDPIQWWLVAGMVTILLFILNAVFSNMAEKQIAITAEYAITDSTQNKPITTPSFTINKSMVPVKFVSYCNVSNTWAELGIDLVNEKTNNTRSFAMGMEYYSGVDDGYSWAEGNMTKTEYLCSVTAGTYHLVITPMKGTSVNPIKGNVTVTVDPEYNTDVFILAGIFIGLAIIVSIWKYFFESSRWNNSPFSANTN